MSITRIKRNQITDLEVIGSKLANNAVTAGKLDLDLIYPSNLTITGNLTVQGATTIIDTTNTVVADPLIVLARSQSGAAALDSGIVIERGTDTNVAFAWDESNDRFMATFTTETGSTAGTINKSGYADLIVGNLTASNFSANIGNVASGQVVYGTTGGSLKSESDLAYNETTNTLTVAGNVTVGNIRVGTDSINTSGTNIDLTVTTNGGNIATASRINVTNAAASSSTTSGALVIAGGVGIGEKLYVNSNLVVGGTDVINAINTVSNAVSVVSAQVATNSAQMTSADNAISNAVSVVSAAQLSTWNAVSNEVSVRAEASAALESHINTVSNAVSVVGNGISVVSAQVATNSAQMTSADNAISNAVSVVSAAQLSTWNALSNEISVRAAASANLQSAINVVSNAVSTVSAQIATNSAQMTSADNALSVRIDGISNLVSVTSADLASAKSNLQSAINVVSNAISAISNTISAVSAAAQSAINTVSNAVSVVSAAVASVETHVNTVSNAVSVVSAAQLSTWNKVSAILTSSTTFSGATYTFNQTTAATNTGSGAVVVAGGVGIGGALYVSANSQFTNNVNILGNLIVTGSYTIIGSNNTAYTDNIIELHTSTTLAALSADDGKDIGIHIHYFKGTDQHAFLGWDNSSGYLEWQDSGSEGTDTFTGNYGTMRLGNLIANASTAATSTTSGAITTNGGIGVVGNAYIGGNLVVGSTNIVDALSALSNYASVASAGLASVESHVNTVSNAVSVVSAQVATNSAQMTSADNAISNAVSVVSAAQLSTWNAVSNEISVRVAASAALETHINTVSNAVSVVSAAVASVESHVNTVSNAVSVVSAQIATNSAQMTSADNAISNAVSVVSAAQLSTWNALSNEISVRGAASAALESHINTVSNAVSTFANAVSVVSAAAASIETHVNTVSAAAASIETHVNTVSAAAASVETHVNTVSNAVSVVSAQIATNSAQMTSADNAISNAVSVVSAAQLSTWNKVSAILTSSTTFSGATYTFNQATAATNNTSGAVVITGGLGVSGSAFAANISIVGNTIATTNTNGNLILQPNGTGATVVNASGAASNFVVRGDTDTALIFVDATNDNIGIGTATPNTGSKLHITGTNSIIIPKGTTGERPGVGVVTAGMVRFNTSSTDLEFYTGTAWQGTGSTFTVIADDRFTGDGSTVVFTLASAQTTNSCIISINGIVQVPSDAYGVTGGTTLTFTEAPAAGDIIDVREITTTTTIASLTSDNGYNVVEITNAGGVLFSSGTSSATERWRINTAGSFVPSANVSYNIGNATNYVNTVYANTFSGTATQAQYADLAEKYLADARYEPGTVMVFGGTSEITQANTDSDRRVAGVVSDKPAYLMNSELEGQFVTDLALLGRVPCKVIGPIQKGDMLIVAGNGYARSEANPITGSVIGKALQNFEGTTGVIEIVVGRM